MQKPKFSTFTVRLSEQERHLLQQMADADTRPAGELVRHLLRQAARERLPRPEQGKSAAVPGVEYAR